MLYNQPFLLPIIKKHIFIQAQVAFFIYTWPVLQAKLFGQSVALHRDGRDIVGECLLSLLTRQSPAHSNPVTPVLGGGIFPAVLGCSVNGKVNYL